MIAFKKAIARQVCPPEFGTIGGCDGKSDLGVMAFAKSCLDVDGASCLAGRGKLLLFRGHP